MQVRGYADAKPKPGVLLRLLARNNDILAEATTDAQGVARFARALLRGEGSLEPGSIHAFADTDFASLDLNTAAFDLSDRGVDGMPHPGPLDGFVWFDRGIYRPGETVQSMALVRDAAGLPADVPVQVTVKRPGRADLPQGHPAAPRRSRDPPAGGARRGLLRHLDGGVARRPRPAADRPRRVPRRCLRAGPHGRRCRPAAAGAFRRPRRERAGGRPLPLRCAGCRPHRRGHGAWWGTPRPSRRWRASHRPGGRAPSLPLRQIELPETDPQGKTTLALNIGRLPDTTFALKAEIEVAVNDPSGRASRAAVSVPVRPDGPLIGVKPLFDGNAVDDQAEAGFDIVAVGPEGARVPLNARLRLVRERPDWRMVMRGSLARYEAVWRDEPLETRDIAIGTGEAFRYARKLDFGRYRLEVAQANGMAITSTRFRAGWAASESPDAPDRVDVSAATRAAKVGESVKVHIAPPFAGEATVALCRSAPRAVAAHRGGGGGRHRYRRASGGKRAGRRTPPCTCSRAAAAASGPAAPSASPGSASTPPRAPWPLRSRRRSACRRARAASCRCAWRRAPGDTGCGGRGHPAPHPFRDAQPRRALSRPPPPWAGSRRLGRLIAPAEGEATLLKQGGDEGGFALPVVRSAP